MAGVVEGAHHLQRREHAVRAVELAPGRLSVEMAARHHRAMARVPAGPARKDVACRVDADSAAGVPAPGNEQVARLPVQIGKRLAVDASLPGRTDPRHAHEAVPEPAGIDPRASAHVVTGSHAANASP